MSRTASYADCGSVANGAARRTSASASSTCHVVERGHRDDLLGEHVERVARHAHRLDEPVAHPLDDDGGLHEVAAVLREHDALAHRADLVARAADALQPARDARRRLDLDHEVDRAHVDAELEAARRDDRGEPPGLEVVLDERALLLAHRAVVGAGEHLRARRRSSPAWPIDAAGADAGLERLAGRGARPRSR